MSIIIRPVAPASDIKEITAINRWYVENTTITFDTRPLTEEEMLERVHSISGCFPYLICEEEGQLVGYAFAHPWKERQAYHITWETTIYLTPQAAGKGIGKLLMAELISACRQRGCHSLIACITEENTVSCKFHEKLGFRKVSHFRQVGEKFGRLLDVVDYQLILD